MKPPPTFVNKRKLVILLVLLCLVGMSSHYVKFGDLPFGDPLVEGSDAGGGYGLPPPHSGVTGSGGGIDCRWCGEHTHQIPPTYARIQGKHVNQTCLHTRSYGGRCEGTWGRILGGNAPHSTPNHLLTFVCDIGRDWTRGDDYVRVCDHAPTQEFGGSGDGAHAVLARAPNITGRYGSGVESGDSTPTSIYHPLPKFTKVLVGVDPPTISNVRTCSCGVVVCVHTHNNTNSSPFIAVFVCGGGGMDGGVSLGGKEGCGVGFVTHPHTLLFSYSFLLCLMWWVLRFGALTSIYIFRVGFIFEIEDGAKPFSNFSFICN